MKEGMKTAADETRNVPMERRSKVAADGTRAVLVKRGSIRIPS
jgi:hypothetical protein